jgi:tetratricopeptide (TPR) repeat protein
MRPSRRVRNLEPDRQRSVAQIRGLDARRLERRLRGDLDWIVLRALAVDREERYGSAAALADDLERMLRHEPVTARPASLPDRVAKLARRYRLATALAVLTMTSITLAAIFSFLALVRTQQAEAEAQRAETEARAEAAAARQTMDFLVSLFEAAKPEEDHGQDVSARTLVARGAETLREDDLPPLQRARLLHTLGDVQMRLGDYDSGRELAYQALELRESQLEGEHPDILETLDLLGSLERRAGRLEEAETLVERLVRAREALGEAVPLADALNTLANLRWRQGRAKEAEELHRRALDLRRAARDEARRTGTPEPALESAVAASLNNLGVIVWTQKRYDEAEPILREAAEDYERRLGSEHPRVADALGNLGLVLRSSGRVAEGAELHRRVLAIRLKTQGPDHPETATAQDGLARALELLEEYREAETLYLQSLATRREVLGEAHHLTLQSAKHLHRLYGKTGQQEDAERIEREVPGVLEDGD